MHRATRLMDDVSDDVRDVLAEQQVRGGDVAR